VNGEPQDVVAEAMGRHIRALCVDIDESGRRATVLVKARSGDLIVRYCVLVGGAWTLSDRDAAASAGLTWSSEFSSSDAVPVLTLVEEVPPAVDEVTVSFLGHERQIPASHGFFIASWWGVDAPTADRNPPVVVLYGAKSASDSQRCDNG
jgi:hypothetical protein